MSISSMAAVVMGTPAWVWGTPAWVWLLLAFVVYRSINAMLPRRVHPLSPVLLPAITMLISVSHGGVPASMAVQSAWFLALLAGLAIGAAVAAHMSISVEAGPPARLMLPGSWITLVLILAIFALRYVSGAWSAIDPAGAAAAGPSLAFALCRGLFSGIFLGRGLTLVARGWLMLRDRLADA